MASRWSHLHPTDDPLLALNSSPGAGVRGRARISSTREVRACFATTELATRSTSTVASFESWGVTPGERFAVVVADPLTFASWFLAGIAMGAWVAPLDPTPGRPGDVERPRHAPSVRTFVVSDQTRRLRARSNWISASARATDAAIDRRRRPKTPREAGSSCRRPERRARPR